MVTREKRRSLSWKRALAVTAVVLFWGIVMAIQIRREKGHRPADGLNTLPVEPTESWFVAELADGSRVGFFHVLQDREERDGRKGGVHQMEADLHLMLLGRPAELSLTGSVWRPLVPDELQFRFRVATGEHDFEVSGTAGGGELKGAVRTAGESVPFSYPVGDELLFTGGLGSTATLPALEPGEETFVDHFDPLTLSPGRARVQCVGKEPLMVGDVEIPTRVLTLTSPGLEARAWIDVDGQVLRLESPFGIVLRRVTRDLALADVSDPPYSSSDPGALLELTAVRPRGKNPIRGAKRMTIRITGVPDLGAVYEIISPPPAPTPSHEETPNDEDLSPDPLVQSHHPRIRTRAAAIVGEATTPWQKAVLLHDWVYGEVEKVPVLSLPSALDVLETREGDCNEHTVLFVALARASNVPARIAIGVVWSDELQGFYYHAWPEVFTDRWVPMDPTLGQRTADATHVKLLTGSIDRWTELVRYLGKLEIEVLEIEGP